MLPNEVGMLPLKKLLPSSISSKLSQLHKELGSSSDRLFDAISKFVSCLAFPILACSAPCRFLKDKLIFTIVGIAKISLGIAMKIVGRNAECPKHLELS